MKLGCSEHGESHTPHSESAELRSKQRRRRSDVDWFVKLKRMLPQNRCRSGTPHASANHVGESTVAVSPSFRFGRWNTHSEQSGVPNQIGRFGIENKDIGRQPS